MIKASNPHISCIQIQKNLHAREMSPKLSVDGFIWKKKYAKI